MLDTLSSHEGLWRSLSELRRHGHKVLDDDEIAKVVKQDLKEGEPVILGDSVYTIFLYDYVNLRFFLEYQFTATTKLELLNAYHALKGVP